MKVILLEDVKALGKKGELVEVNEGYARNFILKKKLGLEATAKNLNDLKLKKANAEKVAKEQLEAAKVFAEELKEKVVTVKIKTGEGGRVFGSVSTKEIAAAAKSQLNLDIDKKKLNLQEPIRMVGTVIVPYKVHPQVTGELKVKVVEA
ncbi:50S ribosomal protein L9 [Frisingicoccus sp.]|uniref:50S ribosomal protein L9 n=1 Tax=Frisingicoccus sp. TaxID=1918627 RepID=UPI0025B87FAD|nr:50S ribosomal protein L9 [Frisingicoccus sp.]MDD6232743.1 50S ribosomal protein L9 [Frisingicoccus sp.]MDY4834418.1 50S ribosomal protein L9 [Frisingicoccus sp.]MDY4922422.1 50S ribosomal protein L9 [Frisingicoccus sp.]MDY5956520.1 50S ribosomal protein L9 [Frisingicoccus sp.]